MKKRSLDSDSRYRVGIPRARARFLTQAIQLEESDAPGIVGMGVFFTALLLAGSVAWASITELTEVSRSKGEVVPAGLIHKVQHLDGGLVGDIQVRNGSRVEKGDRLLSLSPTAAQSELDQLESRRVDIVLKLRRARALLDKVPPDFSDIAPQHHGLIAGQRAFYHDQVASRRQQLALLDSQISQRTGELESLRGQLSAAKDEIGLLRQLRNMRSELAEKQIVARAEVINVSVRLAEAVRELRQLQGSEHVAADAIDEARQRRNEIESRFRESDSEEASALNSELVDVEQTLLRTRERLDRLDVRAPVGGIVKGLSITTIGSVVAPGEVLLEIVPVGEALIVESRISTRDVGHIHPGQPVDVNVKSYDSARFGTLPGTLQRVSASTYLDEQNMPYYRAEISLERGYLGNDPNRHPILPGMTVEAGIVTGKKTVLDYMLKPVYRGFGNALRER